MAWEAIPELLNANTYCGKKCLKDAYIYDSCKQFNPLLFMMLHGHKQAVRQINLGANYMIATILKLSQDGFCLCLKNILINYSPYIPIKDVVETNRR